MEAGRLYRQDAGAGGFLYIAMVDLLAEIKKDHAGPSAGVKVALLLLGFGMIYGLGILLPEMH